MFVVRLPFLCLVSCLLFLPLDALWAGPIDQAIKSVIVVVPDWPGGYRRQGNALEEPEGSAVAVLPGGYFVTNAHVLGRATDVNIRLGDSRLRSAEIVGRDVRTDIALLRVDLSLSILELAQPPGLGARVCAIGNQFGLGVSVTCGVVSAVNRTNTGFNPIEDFIQTDAAVNPGASGGALVDERGRLVGLLSAIFTKQSDANIGVNFATSSALMMRVVEDLRDFGRVRTGRLGWRLKALTTSERKQWSGVRVKWLDPLGPAAVAGVRVGDILISVDKRSIFQMSDASAAIYMRRPGEKVRIAFLRENRIIRMEAELTQ